MQTFESAHQRLRYGKEKYNRASDEDEINQSFSELQLHFDGIQSSVNLLLAESSPADHDKLVAAIVNHEKEYLPRMHAIVGMLSKSARDRVARLQLVEYVLCLATLFALVIEGFFVFEPAARRIAHQLHELSATKQRLASEFEALNHSTARAEFLPSGVFSDVNQKFIDNLEYQKDDLVGNHISILSSDAKDSTIERIWPKLREGKCQRAHFQWKTKGNETRYLQATFNPIIDNDGDTITRIVVYAKRRGETTGKATSECCMLCNHATDELSESASKTQ